jgi:hypothetical protein
VHPAAREGFLKQLAASWLVPATVLDLGGQNVNGHVYGGFPQPFVLDVLDLEPGPTETLLPSAGGIAWVLNSTIAADARTWRPEPDSPGYDLVMSTELLEHVDGWVDVIATARAVVVPNGWFVGTCAGPGRAPHGATGAPAPGVDEHYANVDPVELMTALRAHFSYAVVEFVSDELTADVYWRAKRSC